MSPVKENMQLSLLKSVVFADFLIAFYCISNATLKLDIMQERIVHSFTRPLSLNVQINSSFSPKNSDALRMQIAFFTFEVTQVLLILNISAVMNHSFHFPVASLAVSTQERMF